MPHTLHDLQRTCHEQVDMYLRALGAEINRDITLNENAISAFSFENLVIVVEAPREQDSFWVYCDVLSLTGLSREQSRIAKEDLLRTNFRIGGRPIAKGVGESSNRDTPDPVLNISVSARATTMAFDDFHELLENFIEASVETKKQLQQSISTAGDSSQ